MERRIVFTDAGSSLTKNEAQKLGMGIIPFRISFGSEETTDFDISSAKFYSMMDSKNLPKTAAPNPEGFIKEYIRLYQEEGVTEIASVHLASVNSRTYESAVIASKSDQLRRECPGLTVLAIDSKAVSLPLLRKAKDAQKWLKDGVSLDDIKARLENTELNNNIVVLGAGGRSSFHNLDKGGRIVGFTNKVKAGTGYILGFVPRITMNSEGGVELYDKSRSEKKGRTDIVDDFMKEIKGAEATKTTKAIKARGFPQEISIGYTRDKEVGQEIKMKIINNGIDPKKVKINDPRELGSGIGTHFGGGGAIVVGYWY
jgi:DegV family protein with EDD domain